MDSRVGEERRKGYFFLLYLKVLFFSTSFLYLDFSFLFAVCRANLQHVLTSVSLFTWCKILWLILGLCLCPFYLRQILILISPGGGPPTWSSSKQTSWEWNIQSIPGLPRVSHGKLPNLATKAQKQDLVKIKRETKNCSKLALIGSYTIWNARFSS